MHIKKNVDYDHITPNHGSMTKSKKKIRICRKKEKTWLKDRTEYNFNAFYQQRRYIANLIKKHRNPPSWESLLRIKQTIKKSLR